MTSKGQLAADYQVSTKTISRFIKKHFQTTNRSKLLTAVEVEKFKEVYGEAKKKSTK
jgi:hypothetical protein